MTSLSSLTSKTAKTMSCSSQQILFEFIFGCNRYKHLYNFARYRVEKKRAHRPSRRMDVQIVESKLKQFQQNCLTWIYVLIPLFTGSNVWGSVGPKPYKLEPIFRWLYVCFGRGVYQHCSHEGFLHSNPPMEFRHSSPEALHTKRRERPLLAKDGTKAKEFS